MKYQIISRQYGGVMPQVVPLYADNWWIQEATAKVITLRQAAAMSGTASEFWFEPAE